MVRIDRVVTRGGDGGMTSLGDGARLRKDTPRIAAIGWLRAVVSGTAVTGETDAMLARIQNDLFDVGADLCVPGDGGDRLRLTDVPLLRLEAEIEAMNADLPALTSFILPGGSEAAARAHMARVIVRRAERCLVAVDGLNPLLQRYLNRLSDHLFVLSRVLNGNGAGDVLWRPGANG